MKYSYKCKDCGSIEEKIRKIADRRDPVECGACGGVCEIAILHAPLVSLDHISGDHVKATDSWVKSREQKMRKERHNLKEHGTYH